MKIRIGYDLQFECSQPLPMMMMMNVHHSRVDDLVQPDQMWTEPFVPLRTYHDGFGNLCTRFVAPPGGIRITADAVVRDSGLPEPTFFTAGQHAIDELPDDVLLFLLGSRYCDTDRLSDFAWSRFGHVEGWARVQAICEFVHQHIRFGYQHARSTRTAWDAYNERVGVCRDFAHLALTLCRCTNIPARYCTGYLGDFGVPVDENPMDFSGWFEAYLDNAWHVFDARHNARRIGRIKIGHGRDAADVAISNTFGPNTLVKFKVWSDDVTTDGALSMAADIYQSSNGDRWRLVRDIASGQVFVRHEANAASGGHTSVSSIDAFLAAGGSGPEHAALRELTKTQAAIRWFTDGR